MEHAVASRCVIEANADIAGIGVRVSIYLQAFLALVPGCLTLFEMDQFTEERQKGLHDAAFIVLAMGMSLVISATALAHSSGATIYHAFIVLNMSWINNITAIVPCFVIAEVDEVGENESNAVQLFKRAVLSFSQKNPIYLLHFSAMSTLGIWLFVGIDSFGSHPACTHSTIYYLAGYYLPADLHSIRIFWIVIYSISAIPIVNVTLLLSCVYGLKALVACLVGSFVKGPSDVGQNPTSLARTINKILLISTAFLLVIRLIVSTEKTIVKNNVSPGEGLWTFGQILSLILIFPAFWIAITETTKVISA